VYRGTAYTVRARGIKPSSALQPRTTIVRSTQENVDAAPSFPEALRLFLEWSQPLEQVVLATWSRYDLWQLDLDLEAHRLPKLAIPFLDVKKLAARIVGTKSFEETARELALDGVAMPNHRAIADARCTARILKRLLRPPV
jgi:inhibitor of KinA sporulation pathway (predicted exonuclease)